MIVEYINVFFISSSNYDIVSIFCEVAVPYCFFILNEKKGLNGGEKFGETSRFHEYDLVQKYGEDVHFLHMYGKLGFS